MLVTTVVGLHGRGPERNRDRNLLICAGDLVAGARLRDIVRAAGQANDAAVGYHFGSRSRLIRAIVDGHMQAMEAEREPTLTELPQAELVDVVRMVVVPIASLLDSAEGRTSCASPPSSPSPPGCAPPGHHPTSPTPPWLRT